MGKNWELPPWHSSYEENNYGDFFYGLVRTYRPNKIVELGTKAGYSSYHMARALRDNGSGTIDCYDLWETYPFSSVPRSFAEKNLVKFKDIATLTLRDAVGVDEMYETVDILHVDLSNDGKILEQILPKWLDKTRQLIIIEGGSEERDAVEWMSKFNKEPIGKWLQSFSQRNDTVFFTFEPFPSVTLISKK